MTNTQLSRLKWIPAQGKPERLPALAAELVQLPVDVLVAASSQVAQVAKDTTTTIPIVMVAGADPVAIGLVSSFSLFHCYISLSPSRRVCQRVASVS
jgi:ABC-type uncharacterized transport system substrate-binding protein